MVPRDPWTCWHRHVVVLYNHLWLASWILCLFRFHQDAMRIHMHRHVVVLYHNLWLVSWILYRCFSVGNFSPFPVRRRAREQKNSIQCCFTVEIFCTCRMQWMVIRQIINFTCDTDIQQSSVILQTYVDCSMQIPRCGWNKHPGSFRFHQDAMRRQNHHLWLVSWILYTCFSVWKVLSFSTLKKDQRAEE